MPDTKKKKIAALPIVGKNLNITPDTVKGLSASVRSINILPSGIGPARLSQGFEGSLPAGAYLPASLIATQGYHPGHSALDIAGPTGTRIYAPQDLRIVQAGPGAFGIDVIGINPASGNRFTFGHFEAVAPGLLPGQIVPAGTLLGFEGSTFTPPGYSSGPHLHLQENLPGGAAVIPSAQDVLNSFVSGLRLPLGSGPSVTYSGNISAPVVNTTLLNKNQSVVNSQATENQTNKAVNSVTTINKSKKTSPTGTSPTGTSPTGTSPTETLSPLSIFKGTILERGQFLTSHSSTDFILMGAGLILFIFGAVLLYGQIMQREFNRELDVIDKTSATVKNATEAAGPFLGG
jgi:murein DD-endopeptidase MepM/ murein hydrolase activator NlpD